MADLIESKIKGIKQLPLFDVSPEIEQYATEFSKRIIEEQLADLDINSSQPDTKIPGDKEHETVNIYSLRHDDEDTYMYVHSQQKGVKEQSMNDHFCQRYEEELHKIGAALHKKGGTKKYEKVWERIGRLKERYPTANKHYHIEVIPDQHQKKT